MAKPLYNINSKQTVLVLGGRGFIGRHAVHYLEKFGANVIIGTRNPETFNRIDGQNRQPQSDRKAVLQNWKTTKDLEELLDGIDIVVNTVGILRERWRESYEQVHHHAVKLIAQECAQRDIRIVHISALELHNSLTSGFATSKARGESALRNSGADWALIRPSLVDGQGGFGARWFRYVAQWPVQFTPTNMHGLFSPIDAHDLGEAIARIALASNTDQTQKERVYELGGMESYRLTEYLKLLRPTQMPVARYINVSPLLARLLSHICDALHLTPYSFAHYELLEHGSAPAINRLEPILGRPPRRVRPQTTQQTSALNESNIINKRSET